ncbi:4'-phosphopantetheinyl transferase family protein [Paenibacillus forsythiae]|uniref:4'-phosphopantetheinyl transferase family protein n=1 Tax=Paenibacillus forsythiae TaxID=365616 RepID=UPI00055BCFB7|nr:4'-phosphopantetheinyl transferase superfamily protein [Paenibacillus forsythiae]
MRVLVRIYGVKIPKSPGVNYHEALNRLSEERRNRTLRFVRKDDRIRSVIAEALVRTLFLRDHQVDNESLRFTVNSYGKPSLAAYPDYHYNLSHSGDYVLCAVDSRPSGIDVEEIKPIDLTIADRFFSGAENRQIREIPKDRRIGYFYQLWTAKESYIKFRGNGLSMPLNSFSIRIDDDHIELSEQDGCLVQEPDCYFKAFEISPQYKATLCSESPNHPGTIEWMDCLDLFKKFVEVSGGNYATR